MVSWLFGLAMQLQNMPIVWILIQSSIFAFGWAKPVPYNPYNLRNQKWGPLMVALGGPISNLTIAFIAAIIARIIGISSLLKQNIVYYSDFQGNLGFNFSNWSQIPELIRGDLGSIFYELMILVIFWNVLLAVFNLIPIPPLDGSKIFYSLFNLKTETMIMLEQYGFLLLFAIIIIDGMTFHILSSILSFVWSLFFTLAGASMT